MDADKICWFYYCEFVGSLRECQQMFRFFYGLTALVGQSLFIFEVSKSHSDTSLLVELLLTSDRPVAQTCKWQHTHNTHNRQIFMPPVGLKPAIPACERPLTHASDRAATGIGLNTARNDVRSLVVDASATLKSRCT